MKNYQLMKGLLAKPKNYAMGDMVNTSGANPFGPGAIGGAAGITNALSTNPAAAGIGLAPTFTPGGSQYQQNVIPGGLGNALGAGALQGSQVQQNLSNVLQNEASGGGPNPAKAMLAQATGANVANQNALAAGVRGSNANPALVARQAAQTGAGIEQQSAGQTAILQAQQQLAAQQQLEHLSAQQQVQQQTANAQNIGMQENLNNSGTSQANAIQGARSGLFGGTLQGQGAASAIQSQGTGGSLAPVNAVANAANNAANQAYSQQVRSDTGMASGGLVGPKSRLGMHLAGKTNMASGGIVPIRVSPGEIYLKPGEAKAVAKGKMSPMAGERIPGKAKVKGDSLKNDTVDKNAEAGGVVVKRTKATDPDKAAAFVRAVMAKNKRR